MLAPALLLSLACSKKVLVPPSDLGSLPADAVKLADHPDLAHLGAVYTGGAQATVADLYRATTLNGPPDPTAVLIADQASNADNYNEGVPLRVLAYNIALLDVYVFGFIPYKRTPFLEERRDELPALILEQGYDVVGLQEVWQPEDLARFMDEAQKRGYRAFHADREAYNDGVLTLIKAELIAPGTEPVVHAQAYEAQDPQEYFPGPRIKRGFVEVEFTHPTLGRLLVYNTHKLAFPARWPERMSEARELGSRVSSRVGSDAVALVTGDMNAGSYYKMDTWQPPEGELDQGWWENAASYALLRYYGGLSDLYVRGRPAEEASRDVVLGQKVAALMEASGNGRADISAHCAELLFPHGFSASDCNVLYGMQYKDTEMPARMDLVFAADPSDRVYVTGATHTFTERRSFDGSPEMEPSDHLGVAVELRVAVPGAPKVSPPGTAPAEPAPVEGAAPAEATPTQK